MLLSKLGLGLRGENIWVMKRNTRANNTEEGNDLSKWDVEVEHTVLTA